jgi:MFS family permease
LSDSRFTSVRGTAFRRYWLGETASTLAWQMLVVAVGWQMYELTDSALNLGLIGLVQFLSQLLFTLAAGYAADRYDRRYIALACQLVQCALAVALASASYGGWVSSGFLYGCAFLLGTAQAFQSPTLRALLPGLVAREVLARSIAWTSAVKKAAVIAGPALGGVIYVIDASVAYGASAISFALAGALLASILVPYREPDPEPVTLKSLFGGIAYMRRHPVILGAITLDLFATLLGGATALLPIYAKDILDTGPWGLGLLRAAPAVGAVLVSAYLLRSPFRHEVGRIMFVSVAIFGAATIVFGLSRSLPLSLAALVVMGASDMVSVVIRLSLVQLDTPDEMRGRVSAVNSLCTGTSNHVGQFRSGLTADWFGVVPAVVIGGIGTLAIVALWMRWFPDLARRQSLQT